AHFRKDAGEPSSNQRSLYYEPLTPSLCLLYAFWRPVFLSSDLDIVKGGVKKHITAESKGGRSPLPPSRKPLQRYRPLKEEGISSSLKSICHYIVSFLRPARD